MFKSQSIHYILAIEGFQLLFWYGLYNSWREMRECRQTMDSKATASKNLLLRKQFTKIAVGLARLTLPKDWYNSVLLFNKRIQCIKCSEQQTSKDSL